MWFNNVCIGLLSTIITFLYITTKYCLSLSCGNLSFVVFKNVMWSRCVKYYCLFDLIFKDYSYLLVNTFFFMKEEKHKD